MKIVQNVFYFPSVINSKYSTRDGAGNYFNMYKGLTTNCRANTQTILQIFPNFDESKVLQSKNYI